MGEPPGEWLWIRLGDTLLISLRPKMILCDEYKWSLKLKSYKGNLSGCVLKNECAGLIIIILMVLVLWCGSLSYTTTTNTWKNQGMQNFPEN